MSCEGTWVWLVGLGHSQWGSQGPGCGLGGSPAALSGPVRLSLSPGASLTG